MLGCKGLFERCAPLFYIILHSRRLIILNSAYVFFKEIFKRFFLVVLSFYSYLIHLFSQSVWL